jgi:ZIP family zinc transporter
MTPTVLNILLISFGAGLTVFLGGVLARSFNHHLEKSPISKQITHTMVAFGGGIIFSALALVMVPTALDELALQELIPSFLAGALVFFFLDRRLQRKKTKAGTLMAMLLDYIPESIALGALFAGDFSTAVLLAFFIGLQNIPEAFNAYRDMILSGFQEKATLIIFFFISFCGVIGALLGFFFLTDHPQITAHLMIFASGGILYLLFQDIAPQAQLKTTNIPSLGATLGFIVGMIGEKLI